METVLTNDGTAVAITVLSPPFTLTLGSEAYIQSCFVSMHVAACTRLSMHARTHIEIHVLTAHTHTHAMQTAHYTRVHTHTHTYMYVLTGTHNTHICYADSTLHTRMHIEILTSQLRFLLCCNCITRVMFQLPHTKII